ncbi:MAG: BrnA antitoxin family protein [Pseudomonadota bacterium]
MPRKKNKSTADLENPEWTKADFARARPIEDMLPPNVVAQFRRSRGRPALEHPKEAIKLRLDADIVAAFRATGPGWQTRINDTLRRAKPTARQKPMRKKA